MLLKKNQFKEWNRLQFNFYLVASIGGRHPTVEVSALEALGGNVLVAASVADCLGGFQS